jgi:1-acyl-sn-glycerol-3-phosphate acyltransferase
LGAWPLADTLKGTMRLLEAIQKMLGRHQVIAIYPEAHIWPFYTKIRPFPATSFQYASRNGVPAVPIVTTYRHPRGLFAAYRKPLMDVHIGEPIYPLAMFDIKENALRMHAHTISFMRCYATDESNVALYEYVNKQGV